MSAKPTNPNDPKPPQPEHSMKEEEPLGWDEGPKGEDEATPHPQPRQMGKGGTPDEEMPLDEAQASEADAPSHKERSE